MISVTQLHMERLMIEQYKMMTRPPSTEVDERTKDVIPKMTPPSTWEMAFHVAIAA